MLLIVIGVLALAYSMAVDLLVAAFIGLGLLFWGVVFSLARTGRYVESALLDGTAKSAYSTFDRVINDLKFNGQGYYIPPYPQDAALPEYLGALREPVVFISDSYEGKLSVDELAAGRFLSQKTNGVFLTSPGSELMAQMERRLHVDFSKMQMREIVQFVPKALTETLSLAKSASLTLVQDGVIFKATGISYPSLYRSQPPMKSVSLLGCPAVSAVASILAKSTGKTVVIKEQVLSPANCGVSTTFGFV